MALRVLLADESSTIKKVMQLALQDFAVEVKTVHVGVDVIEVARAFKPDIIFVDVLLQKKSGYEVCAELKNEATTRHTPTVLMWSSFMELDQAQLEKAQPTSKIEKPFDVETLRKLVLGLVPETRSQRLSHFLEFPEAPTNEGQENSTRANTAGTIPLPPPIANSRANIEIPPSETIPLPPPPPPGPHSKAAIQMPPSPTAAKAAPEPAKKPVETPAPPKTQPTEEKRSWNMESFDDINEFASNAPAENLRPSEGDEEEFQPMNLSKVQPAPELALEPVVEPAQETKDEKWAHRDLSRFKIDLPPVTVEDDGMDLKIDMAEDEMTASGFLYRPELESQNAIVEDAIQMEPSELELDAPPENVAVGEDATQPLLEVEEQTARLVLEREEIPQPLEPMEASQGDYRPSWQRDSQIDIPQIGADRVEAIIRAQSREVIEEIVRRVVPDIATALIREELERLLEDTSVRESRRREPRP